MSGTVHTSVLLQEVLDVVEPRTGQTIIDGTLGGGGYTTALAKAVGSTGRVIAFDRDATAIARYQPLAPPNVTLIHDNFSHLAAYAKKFNHRVNGIVLDLGLASDQIEDRTRGFSWQDSATLDMRFDQTTGPDALYLLNHATADELTEIFRSYADESLARPIAKTITARRRGYNAISSATDLADLVSGVYRRHGRRPKIAPATKVFQALRIAVNDELGSLRVVLPAAVSILQSGGRLVVVSFHSGEDRIVKDFFKQEAADCVCPPSLPICQCDHQATLKIITKKPLIPTEREVRANPRARSAKLRAAAKL